MKKTTKTTKNPTPLHKLANGNQKWQCNGPQAWGTIFAQLAADPALPTHERGKLGVGVRLALEAGIKALSGAKLAPPEKVKKAAKAAKATEADVKAKVAEVSK